MLVLSYCVVLAPAHAAADAADAAWKQFSTRSQRALSGLRETPEPVSDNVPEIKFAEFFGPIGDRGLEYSAKLRALNGQKVRLTGFIVREQVHARGICLLAPWPLTIEASGLCFYDDAPPALAHIVAPAAGGETPMIPFRPGRIALTGTLEIGPRPEADGRNSAVRLMLDAAGLSQITGQPVASATQN